jgi:hypothetical protein
MSMRIAVINFWSGAFEGDFLAYLFREAFGDYERTPDPADADLVVTSVFGAVPSPRNKTILYLGENIRPNFTRCRYSLSFDYDTYGGRNHRLPLWWSRLGWPGYERLPIPRRDAGAAAHHDHEELIPVDALLRPRSMSDFAARRFCAAVAANPEPLRITLFLALRTIAPVTGYGRMFGAALDRSKFAVLPGYRFALCPENSIYPGYHTEKLVDAWYGGCLPLYSGDRLVGRDFNPRAFINYQDLLDLDAFVALVGRLNSDEEAFAQMYDAPLLLSRPSLGPTVQFLRAAAAGIRSGAAA